MLRNYQTNCWLAHHSRRFKPHFLIPDFLIKLHILIFVLVCKGVWFMLARHGGLSSPTPWLRRRKRKRAQLHDLWRWPGHQQRRNTANYLLQRVRTILDDKLGPTSRDPRHSWSGVVLATSTGMTIPWHVPDFFSKGSSEQRRLLIRHFFGVWSDTFTEDVCW